MLKMIKSKNVLDFFPFFLQTDLRRQILGELISLYYATFLVSVRSLNVTEDIFSMEELFIEIEDYIM